MTDSKQRVKTPILKAEKVHKWFGKIHALKGLDFEISPREAVGLVGDNGAGKSTFAKIIAGVMNQSEGKLYWKGRETEIHSIKDARELGIETVYQEQALIGNLSVAKNIFLGRELTDYGSLNILNEEQMEHKARDVITRLGLRVNPTQKVRFCSGGERQGVAVARALLFKANLVILDEPTSALSSKGVEQIRHSIEGLKEDDISVILISHIFPQIFPVTDRFVILSQGKKIAEKKQKETSTDELSKIIIEGSDGV